MCNRGCPGEWKNGEGCMIKGRLCKEYTCDQCGTVSTGFDLKDCGNKCPECGEAMP